MTVSCWGLLLILHNISNKKCVITGRSSNGHALLSEITDVIATGVNLPLMS